MGRRGAGTAAESGAQSVPAPVPAPAAAPGAAVVRLPIDDSLFFKLVRIVNLTARPFMETLSTTHQLTLNEWRAMLVLASHPGVAAREVADHTGLDKMSVSRALAALERQGRIVKSPDPQDARRTQLHLSADGRQLFDTIAPSAAQREAQLYVALDEADVAQMHRLADRLMAAL
jgi:DNA-binding MarR family transcriptional regulator